MCIRDRAQAAQQKAQAAIESDELNYEAVKKEIQKLIAAASASKPQLSFSGFACQMCIRDSHRPLYWSARPAGKPPQQADPCGQPWACLLYTSRCV